MISTALRAITLGSAASTGATTLERLEQDATSRQSMAQPTYDFTFSVAFSGQSYVPEACTAWPPAPTTVMPTGRLWPTSRLRHRQSSLAPGEGESGQALKLELRVATRTAIKDETEVPVQSSILLGS